MVSRINDPNYLKLNLPLNNHTDDVSGNGNDGTPTDLTYSTNQFGKGCGSFNGSSSYTRIPNNAELNPSDKITLSMWIKPLGFQVSYTYLLNLYDAPSSEHSYLLGYGDGEKGRFRVYIDSSWINVISTDDIPTNIWTHIVGIYDGSNIHIYINGKLSNSTPATGYLGTSSKDLYLSSNIGATSFFNGLISDSRIYNIALTGDEVLQLFKQTVPMQTSLEQPKNTLPDITDPSLVGSWLNSETRGTAKDYSSEGNDGTNNGVILGRDGGEFNGGSSYISLSDNLLSGTMSIFMIVKFNDLTDTSFLIRNIAGDPQNTFYLALDANNLSYGWRKDDNGVDRRSFFSHSEYLVNDAYYYLGFIIDSVSGEMKLYINGELVKSEIKIYPIGTIVNPTTIGIPISQTLNGQMQDIQIYSEIKNHAWVTKNFQKLALDDSLKLHILNGDKDVSINRTSLTLTDCIIGDGLELSYGGIAWSSITFTSYEYWYKTSGQWKYYLNDGTNTYINGILTGSMPVSISATGFSGVTGSMKDIKLFNEAKSVDYALDNYNKTRKYY